MGGRRLISETVFVRLGLPDCSRDDVKHPVTSAKSLNSRRRLLLVLAFVIAGRTSTTAAESIALTRDHVAASLIVYPRNDQLLANTARKLAAYVKAQTDLEIPIATEEVLAAPHRSTTLIVLDGTPEHRLAAKLGQAIDLSSEDPDAYHLRAVAAGANSGPLILAAGRGASGAKYAAYRLMRELEITGGEARLRPMDVAAAPWIKTRSVSLFNVWGMPVELTRRHNPESWSVERLEQYLDMYDSFGFNAIESHDRFNDNYLEPLFGLNRAAWREKVLRMCAHAHENGQQFFLRIWGHTVMETPKYTEPLGPTASVPKRLAYLCVNDPVQRKRWEEEILGYYVTHYAGRIDHLIGHWCDPGVCRKNGCDFTTPLKLQMELHRAFKAVDPHFTSSFSLWFFDVTKNNRAAWARGGWPGYETDFDLINAGILDHDVVIATATTKPDSYRDDVVSAINSAGHQAAVWTWYRADHEIRPSLHVHLHERLGDYFRNLPASAHQLAWHNVERNVHGAANTANYYVAGRLMWEPSLDVDALLREFLTLVYGSENAAKVMPAYLAIERIRCHSCDKNWEKARFTGAGTDNPRADLATAQAALDLLASVRIDAGFRPRLPLDVSPAQIVLDLKASLEVIRDFAQCRAEAFPAIERAIAGKNQTDAGARLDALEARFEGWTHTLAGRQEWSVMEGRIQQNRRQLESGAPR